MFATQSVDPRLAKYELNIPQLRDNIVVAVNAINAVKTTLVQQNIRALMYTYSTSDVYAISTASYSIGLSPLHTELDAAVVFLENLYSTRKLGGY